MQTNKFLIFLSKLSKSEMRAFSKYLSKMHTDEHKLCKLWEHLKKYYPRFTSKQLKAEDVFFKLYEDKEFDRKLLLTMVSKLKDELKRFLIWKYQDSFSYESDFILLQLYKKYGLKEEVQKQLAKMKETNEAMLGKDIWYWQRKIRLADEDYHYIASERINDPNAKRQLDEAMGSLDLFYAATKLQYSAEYYNRQQVLKEAVPEIKLLNELNRSQWEPSYLIHHSYQLALQMIKEKNESSFHQLKAIVLKQSKYFHKNDRLILITYLLNYLFASLREGNYQLINQAFELYKYGIEHELFIIDDHFEYNHFENIINFACQLKALEWVQKFLEKWKDALKEDIKEDVILLSESFIRFSQKEFETITDTFLYHKGRFKSVYHRAKFRVLDIASLVETKADTEMIINKCKALEKNVRGDKLMNEAMKKGLLNFSKIVKALLNFQPDKIKLQKKLQKYKALHFRFWLTEKIEAL